MNLFMRYGKNVKGMRYEAWSMEHGAWGVGHGAWGMGRGAWGVGHGAWGMGHGAWSERKSRRDDSMVEGRTHHPFSARNRNV
jgi:hypothetical protein